MNRLVLYGYWRSSATWRVRIALNLKGLDAEHVAVHLSATDGDQLSAEHAALNPSESVTVTVSMSLLAKTSVTESSVL